MKLDEWLISQGEDPELMYSGDYELVKGAWNTAFEEAALEMDLKYEGGMVFADAIRLLKEE